MISSQMLFDTVEKTKKYESITHTHDKGVVCIRCKFDKAESSLEDKKKFLNKDSTTKTKKGVKKLKKMIVVRGELDDVVGWKMIWQ